MNVLIDSLLRLSRISRQNIEFEFINLSKMCEAIIRNCLDLVPNNNLYLSIQPGIFAYCDAKLMRIALENLIDNALKYSSLEPSPEITIGIKQEGDEQVIYINDNGVGFDPLFADKVFQPFQRLHSGEFSGTGIGLATVQRIIERHGGRIWAESLPKQGARFYFVLPGSYSQQYEQQYSAS
jgi:signal transduction histidine kinase